MNKAKIRVGLGILSAYVGLFAYIGLFSVPTGDDYVGYIIFSFGGFFQAIIDYWLQIGSRFTGSVIVNLGNAAGLMDNYYIAAPLALIISLSSLYFLITSLFERLPLTAKLFTVFLLQSMWLASAMQLHTTLYWLAGLNYYWTSSFFLIEFALIVNIYNGKNIKLYLCLLGIMVFLNSGMSELSAAYQIPMFAGAAFITALSDNKRCLKYMLIMLLIAFAGLWLHMINPGNLNRISKFLPLFGPNIEPITKSFFMAYRIGVLAGLISSFHFFTRPVMIYVLLLFMPVVSDYIRQPKFAEKMPFRFKIWHICFFEIVTVCCFQAVGGYAMGNALYLRAMSIVRWIMMAQWILFFVFLYRNPKLTEWIRNRRIYQYKEIILLIYLLTSANFSLAMTDCGIAREYSRQLGERREYIRLQKELGNLDIIVPPINVHPQLFIGDSIPPKGSPGNNYAYYYGLNSIREEDPFIMEAMSGERGYKDEEARIKLIISLAEQGNTNAQFWLARYYDTSDRLTSPYIKKNDKSALEYYFKLADKGVQSAKDLLWTFYMGGLRTDRDWDVIKWGLKSMLSPF